MSAGSLNILTRVIPDPKANNGAIDEPPVNSTLSYQNDLTGDTRTLSTGGQSPEDLGGFLYVPDLTQSNTVCQNISVFSTGVITVDDGGIPDSYDLIAVAPWLSPECVLAYMAQAKADAAMAFVFYIPGSGMLIPPTANSGVWDLDDGGQWKSMNRYPVYAIPGDQGTNVVSALSRYSGRNLSAVPDGNLLSNTYAPSSLVRLYMDITVDNAPALPSLWNFLLIVLGILLFFVAVVSFAMHWFQRRRRANLRRRIASGEVDLAELGIVKRLTVPREVLDKLPLQTYDNDGKIASVPLHPEKESRAFITDLDPIGDDLEKRSIEISELPRRNSDTTDLRTSATSLSVVPPSYVSTDPKPLAAVAADTAVPPVPPTPHSRKPQRASRFSQPTCAICLDDFVPSQTTIRTLPCQHIFHPECVDDFLLNTSSLCPMCKTSVLPKGYCPTEVTNAMVRRERRLQIIRQARAERHRRRESTLSSGQLSNPTNGSEVSPATAGSQDRRQNRVISPLPIPVPSLRLFHSARFGPGLRISSAPTPSTIESRRRQAELRPTPGASDTAVPVTASLGFTSDASAPGVSAPQLQRTGESAQTQSRREWARQRALALMNRGTSVSGNGDTTTVIGTATELDQDEERARPGRMKRTLAAVFPGFR
ncbi:MAG: hypothetical protein M1822_006552 [Bathelium mastoideum]|nr:MAG: hypothetical protein M1822_006552 [Bathelium mastoideum]